MADLKRFIKEKGLKQYEFAEQTGVDKYQLSRIINGKERLSIDNQRKIVATFPDFEQYSKRNTNIPVYEYGAEGKEIPFYPVEVFATISPNLSDVVALQPHTFINIPMFSNGQTAVQVTGHSMKGLINHGDWIVIKKITNKDAIIYSEPYLIVTKSDNLKTVKFIKESTEPDSLVLVPYNIEQFESQEIMKDEILEMYIIVGLFRSL